MTEAGGKTYQAYIQYNAQAQWYAGFIPGIPGAEAQGHSMEELKDNLRVALNRCLRERRKVRQSLQDHPKPPGFYQIDLIA